MRTRFILVVVAALLVGVALGAYIFKDTRARSFLAIPSCGTACLTKTELVGLLVSVGVQKIPSALSVVKETDKAIALKSPDPLATIDYLVLPKKDIRDLGDLSSDDRAYIDDVFLIISELVRDNHLIEYKIISNGPGFQTANYLHFHLLAQ